MRGLDVLSFGHRFADEVEEGRRTGRRAAVLLCRDDEDEEVLEVGAYVPFALLPLVVEHFAVDLAVLRGHRRRLCRDAEEEQREDEHGFATWTV